MQPTSAVMLFAAKSENIFQDATILVILIKFDLHLLKVALLFFSKYCYNISLKFVLLLPGYYYHFFLGKSFL